MWFAFRFYLCIQSQRCKTTTQVDQSCDLLSDFIFVFNHNRQKALCTQVLVVICFQILSLYSITTLFFAVISFDMLWFAFRFYLCIQSQPQVLFKFQSRQLWFAFRFYLCIQSQPAYVKPHSRYGCDLLSDFIFVFNHNCFDIVDIIAAVVICFQILSLYSITTVILLG